MFDAHRVTASCSWSLIQSHASGELKNDPEGESTSESRSPNALLESPLMRSGRDSGVREEDTTWGIGGGEAEESLDPGTPAKRKWRRV